MNQQPLRAGVPQNTLKASNGQMQPGKQGMQQTMQQRGNGSQFLQNNSNMQQRSLINQRVNGLTKFLFLDWD